MNLLLATLAVLSSQDLEKTIDDLLSKLASDSLVEREEAGDALVKLGRDAAPILEKKLKSAEGDQRERMEKVLARLKGEDRRLEVLPPIKMVSVKGSSKRATEILEEIRKQSGVPLRFNEKDATLVTMSVENVTPFQALDELSRQTQSVRYWFDRDRDSGIKGEGDSDRSPEVFVDYPCTYARHYKIAITNVNLWKTNNFQSESSGASLEINIEWLPTAKPDAMRLLRVDEIVDDKGNSVYDPKEDPGDSIYEIDHSAWSDPSMGRTISLPYPADGVRKIVRIKGKAAFRYSEGTQKLVFPNPDKAVGKTLEIQGLKVTLAAYDVREGGADVRIQFTGKIDRGVDPYAKPEQGESWSWPFETDDIALILEGGATVETSGAGGSGGGDGGSWELHYNYTGAAPKSLEISLVTKYFYDEFDFEIRDVPFPR